MPVVFPHANNLHISDAIFRQAWADLLRDHDHNNQGPDLPHLHRRWPIAEIEERGYQLGLEFLLRTLVPAAYQNTAQATQGFLAANAHIVIPTRVEVINPPTGRMVAGVQLLPVPQ
jgi:hypothetical protein